jgi:hypothetical protein
MAAVAGTTNADPPVLYMVGLARTVGLYDFPQYCLKESHSKPYNYTVLANPVYLPTCHCLQRQFAVHDALVGIVLCASVSSRCKAIHSL